jgi:hypothetical protein
MFLALLIEVNTGKLSSLYPTLKPCLQYIRCKLKFRAFEIGPPDPLIFSHTALNGNRGLL